MAAVKTRKKAVSPTNLARVARQIADEIHASRAKAAQQTTLRALLARCGYEQATAETTPRLSAALDAAGVNCFPPLASAKHPDETLQFTLAPPRKTSENSAAKEAFSAPLAQTKRRTPRRKIFSSREAMLGHARRATMQISVEDSHGSGFAIDKSGLVLTARHVVGSSEEACLRFENGHEEVAQVIFSDPALDYAFVQSQACGDVLDLRGDVDLEVGQTVFAVGTPFQADLAGTVTHGIISGLDRVVGGVAYIQTDATIHAGHSGGPLLTERGDVAGINLWGRPEEGIRFALPIPYVLEALAVLRPQLKDLKARLYCADCGFLNGAESWILCASWLCCGHCGALLGDLRTREARHPGHCEPVREAHEPEAHEPEAQP